VFCLPPPVWILCKEGKDEIELELSSQGCSQPFSYEIRRLSFITYSLSEDPVFYNARFISAYLSIKINFYENTQNYEQKRPLKYAIHRFPIHRTEPLFGNHG
jgi:hypothetical protein